MKNFCIEAHVLRWCKKSKFLNILYVNIRVLADMLYELQFLLTVREVK